MTGLPEWLRAQLDEDERIARAATAGPWRHNPDKHHRIVGTSLLEEAVFAGPSGDDAICVAATGETDDRQSTKDAIHIAAHAPTRVLREIDAKRRLLDWLERKNEWALDNNLWSWDDDEALLLLALPYADRPGYLPEWRP
ncbi:DUF6221 family protein [Streptomyces sp. NRRL F-5135]|uniref:DUF6221 family protein n=1 Tax=Streptomyces sp. NRRL F-5135 TaxID=1463858 RepID=UPI0004C54D16|nr:DUF6221 family protein [Streptomyces sp. NRRL F-5135]